MHIYMTSLKYYIDFGKKMSPLLDNLQDICTRVESYTKKVLNLNPYNSAI